MREFKFKSYWKDKDGTISTDITAIRFGRGSFTAESQYSNHNLLIGFCQWTGLQDKNGVDIYEGDIINDSEENYEIAFGQFDNDLLDIHGIGFFTKGQTLGGYPLGNNDAPMIEVIGNVYQNAELLNPNPCQD